MQQAADRLWLLDTQVRILVSCDDESHGITIIEHEAPFGDSPPLHRHLHEDETFHVISGTLDIVADGEFKRLGPGQTLRAPKGVSHTYRVVSSDGARLLTITGGREFERFVRRMGRVPTGPGLPQRSGPPSEETAAELVRICAEHGIEVVGPPLT